MDTSQWVERTVKIGKHSVGVITGVYVSDITGEVEWLEVELPRSLFSRKVVVPCIGASSSGREVVLDYDIRLVCNAPKAPKNGHLTREEEMRLKSYYVQEDVSAKVVMKSLDEQDPVRHRRIALQTNNRKHQSFHLVKGKSFRLISEKELV